MTMTVAGKSYSNIIQSRLILSYNILGMEMEAATYDYYTAKGVGVIRVRTTIDNNGLSFNGCTDLIDYNIK